MEEALVHLGATTRSGAISPGTGVTMFLIVDCETNGLPRSWKAPVTDPYGNKWPKLEELYGILFGTRFGGAHDAGVDVAACACCFFELKNRGVIRVC